MAKPEGLLNITSISSMSSADMMAGCLSGRSASAATSSARVSVTTCRETMHDWEIALTVWGVRSVFQDMGRPAEHSSHSFSTLHQCTWENLMWNI